MLSMAEAIIGKDCVVVVLVVLPEKTVSLISLQSEKRRCPLLLWGRVQSFPIFPLGGGKGHVGEMLTGSRQFHFEIWFYSTMKKIQIELSH
jgi:hypothetical protein